MARRWVVLTEDRGPHAADDIIAYTEWDGYLARADEVVYTNPVNANGVAVDGAWKVSGSVTRAGAGTATDPYVYLYADSGLEPSLIDRQRGQIHDAYLYWRIFGRTGHWEGIRRGFTHEIAGVPNVDTRTYPLDATDKWAFHIPALIDQAIKGVFPISGALSAVDLQALIDHADFILRNLGSTWYLAQIGNSKSPSINAVSYAGMFVDDGDPIYTDICTALAVPRPIDGAFGAMAVNIPAGYNPEERTLGN